VSTFPIEQEQAHLKQHHSAMGESYCMLSFHLAKAQAHIEQHHSIMGEI